MSDFKDLTGSKQGYLTIIGLKSNNKRGRSWVCRCDCGKILVLGERWLLGSPTRRPNRSCGCMQLKQKGYSQSEPKLYALWKQMVARCHNKNNNIYYKYGAKGITVCDEWKEEFEPFLMWAKENGYEEGLTLDRIDGDKGYSPDNCRWVNNYVQAANKGIRNTNTTGYTGVCSHYDRYRAYISRNGERKFLGLYDTIEEAAQARKKAEEYFKKYKKIPD